MKTCWLDMRGTPEDSATAIMEEAVHQRIGGIITTDPSTLDGLPPTVKRIAFSEGEPTDAQLTADLVVVDQAGPPTAELRRRHPTIDFGRYVHIHDPKSLDAACEAAKIEDWSVLDFLDPTKIPLEIVLAAGAAGSGSIMTTAGDVEEASIVFGVLEHGSGVVLAPGRVGDATDLAKAASQTTGQLELTELVVDRISHVGMGERACIDTCSYFGKDEGILVGSHSKGLVLCVSETHPLPYMPTRPFRVNAGAIMSYTMSTADRTSYLSELEAGGRVLAVDVTGKTRQVTVGRVKIETRPLLSVDAHGPNGEPVNLILQDDWHVRVLGPGGVVHNSTELKEGDILLGHIPSEDRHVGYPIDEYCREQ